MNADFDMAGYADLILSSGQTCDISVEATAGQTPPLTTMGGTDRSKAWPFVVQGVPCFEHPQSAQLNRNVNDERQGIVDARFYFIGDPVIGKGGISSRHRITRNSVVYAVLGTINAMQVGIVVQVDCEKVRTP